MKYTNIFIIVFLGALLFTFATDGGNWPFMAYDMFAGNYAGLEFSGVTKAGRLVPIKAPHYFHYFEGFHFGHAMLGFYNESPEQFARIAHELRIRYNERSREQIDSIRVARIDYGMRRELPGEFF